MSSSPPDLELDAPVRQDRRFRTRFGRPRSFRTVLREGAPTPVVARRERIGRVSLAMADAVAAALVLGGVIQWSGGSPLWALPLAIPVILVANKVAGLYDRDDLLLNKTTLDEAPQLLQICGLFALVVWLLYEPVTPYVLGSWQVLCLWLGSVTLIIGGRMLARRAARRIGGVQRCLVVGDPHAVGTLARKLRESDADAEVAARPARARGRAARRPHGRRPGGGPPRPHRPRDRRPAQHGRRRDARGHPRGQARGRARDGAAAAVRGRRVVRRVRPGRRPDHARRPALRAHALLAAGQARLRPRRHDGPARWPPRR